MGGLGYAIVEGFRNVSRNTRSSFISIITMIFTMFVFGGFFAIGQNINSFLEQVQMKQGMEVFIYDEVTEAQKDEFETEVKKLDGVNTVTEKSKEQAYEDFKARMASVSEDSAAILEGYSGENNILPASFVITFTDLEKAAEVEKEVERLGARIATEANTEEQAAVVAEATSQAEAKDDEKSEADSTSETEDKKETEEKTETTEKSAKESIIKRIVSKDYVVSTMVSVVRGLRIGIGVIFIILLIFSITIISNTIKLSLHARRKEMSIMKYVGATNRFVRGPYVVEGMILGIISSVISLLLIGAIYDYMIKRIETSNVLKQIGINLLSFVEIADKLVIVYLILGLGIGIIGSAISMKKYLEV